MCLLSVLYPSMAEWHTLRFHLILDKSSYWNYGLDTVVLKSSCPGHKHRTLGFLVLTLSWSYINLWHSGRGPSRVALHRRSHANTRRSRFLILMAK